MNFGCKPTLGVGQCGLQLNGCTIRKLLVGNSVGAIDSPELEVCDYFPWAFSGRNYEERTNSAGWTVQTSFSVKLTRLNKGIGEIFERPPSSTNSITTAHSMTSPPSFCSSSMAA